MDVYTTPEKSHNQDFELVYKGGRGGGGERLYIMYMCSLYTYVYYCQDMEEVIYVASVWGSFHLSHSM